MGSAKFQKMLRQFIIPALLIAAPDFSNGQILKDAQEILGKLYKANGNMIIPRPIVKLSPSQGRAACYLRSVNTIELSPVIFDVCRSMGKDSLAALAFVLGHEFSHAFQNDLKASETNFLAYHRTDNSDVGHEEAADVSGAFMAYLAGYRTLDLMDPFLDRIYDKFNLNHDLRGYPSLAERKQTSQKVRKMVDQLISTYEAANMLSAIGQYELAVSCYEYILGWYHGREIYNNLGVTYSRLALNFTGQNTESYVYPLEMEWGTRMKKPSVSRGAGLPAEMAMLKDHYLQRSQDNMVQAARMDKTFFTADLNIFCIYLLKGAYREAMEFYERNSLQRTSDLLGSEDHRNKLRMSYAIAKARMGEKEQARRIWTDLSHVQNSAIAAQALINLAVLDGEKASAKENTCMTFKPASKDYDGIKLYREYPSGDTILLNAEKGMLMTVRDLPGSKVYVLRQGKGYLRMQRVRGQWNMNRRDLQDPGQIQQTDNGFLYYCADGRFVLNVDRDLKVREWVKYH
ncbi:MAG TPA: hypothetical protein PKD30_10065 [Saprospiraceae bacterium]|nr:hypothetical protein [Saprospiraceae bacterium]HNF10590.1 hypothetical protein [Saprospiraceae bacterium]HNG68028.1 hypothetical protein [Saprospiraceae bacterium]HNM54116.1 hypothetical protein [Saprospiraceae bacterium]